MSGVTDWGSATWSQALFGAGIPAGYWFALLSQEAGPGMDGTAVAALEPAAGGYARQYLAADVTHWDASGAGVAIAADLPWPVASADWGLVAALGLCDAASAGNLYGWITLDQPVFLASGWRFVLPAGSLGLALSSLDPSLT